MKIYNTSDGILIERQGLFFLLNEDWDSFVNNDNLYKDCLAKIANILPIENAVELIENNLLAPVKNQEIWASGVTYYNSKLGREEESKEAGASNFYARVYEAERPELFFKATAQRTVPSGGKVRKRKDSTWDVPEPELTLCITSSGKIIGYTIGNDMSSRSIEGENPLYLPQAKTYDGCASVGPCILITEALPAHTEIHMKIYRDQKNVFEEHIGINQIKRSFSDLVSFLFRECTFPHGCLLMTGTGIVPSAEFNLEQGDKIEIAIDGIGKLINYVA